VTIAVTRRVEPIQAPLEQTRTLGEKVDQRGSVTRSDLRYGHVEGVDLIPGEVLHIFGTAFLAGDGCLGEVGNIAKHDQCPSSASSVHKVSRFCRS
jgi:hypothetical protein